MIVCKSQMWQNITFANTKVAVFVPKVHIRHFCTEHHSSPFGCVTLCCTPTRIANERPNITHHSPQARQSSSTVCVAPQLSNGCSMTCGILIQSAAHEASRPLTVVQTMTDDSHILQDGA